MAFYIFMINKVKVKLEQLLLLFVCLINLSNIKRRNKKSYTYFYRKKNNKKNRSNILKYNYFY